MTRTPEVVGAYRKRRLYFTRSLLLAGAFTTAIARPAGAAQYQFKSATDLPADHASSVWQRQMWDAIERESGGRIQTALFPNSQLGGDPAMLTQLRLGSLEFFLASAGPLSGVVPLAGISQLGFVFKDTDEAFRAMDGGLGELVRQEAATKGIHAFPHMWNSGMQHLTSGTRTINSADDLHGFKVRVSDAKVLVDLFHTLGANPVPFSVGDSYTAMQTRLIDGGTTTLAAVETLHWFEVQQYLILTNHGFGAYWFLANGDVWNGLPDDLKAIIERNVQTYVVRERRDLNTQDAAVLSKLSRQGLKIVRPDVATFRSRLQPYYQTWAATFGTAAWSKLEASVGRLG